MKQAKKDNLGKLQESIFDFFAQTSMTWLGPEDNQLEAIVKQTIGIALKSGKAANYIE